MYRALPQYPASTNYYWLNLQVVKGKDKAGWDSNSQYFQGSQFSQWRERKPSTL